MIEIYVIHDLGFKKAEMEAIENHFLCTLNQDDWESIELDTELELEEGEDIEDSYNYLKLPTGRIAYFPDELLHKETMAQIY